MGHKKKLNIQWERVRGTGTLPVELARQEANKSTLNSGKFIKACEKAGITPTKRQASKFNNQKGAAYKVRNSA